MHHCLEILEIVDIICFHLSPHPRRDLYAMARVCTTFQGPALNYLWSSTQLWKLLTRCMPSDLWAINAQSSGRTKTIRLLRPVRGSDWDRVALYARRVIYLASGSLSEFPFVNSSNILPTVSLSLPETLFSNLQSLDWQHSGVDFHFIRLFLRPTLTTISFTLGSDSESSLLTTLAQTCPRLATISVFSYGYIPALLDFVGVLRRVEDLSLPSLEQDALEHLSHHPTLKTLSLQTLPATLTAPALGGPQKFLKLRELTLGHPDIRATIQYLALCNAVPLNDFNVCFFDIVTAHELRDLFAAISEGFSHSTVAELFLDNQFDESEPEELDPVIHIVQSDSLRPLLCFTNLVSVLIVTPLGVDLDDESVLELARSWPRIENLWLKAKFPTHAPRATLGCLHSFAEHCPHLRQLTITFDATSAPSSDANPGSHFGHHRLRSLGVEHSPLSISPISAARFLSNVFPNLEDIETHREYEDNEDEEELAVHGDAIRLHNRCKKVQELLDQEPSSE
ncbi:hypothetical protein B0H19DRAFT_1141770 [Mycena capillaripes]|nr:hypothetical protein B0H19DRAFT_1141770 [Mycena capillaripes]